MSVAVDATSTRSAAFRVYELQPVFATRRRRDESTRQDSTQDQTTRQPLPALHQVFCSFSSVAPFSRQALILGLNGEE